MQNTPYNDRKCIACADIGDEYHYLFICPKFVSDRTKYIDEYYRKIPCMAKMIKLISASELTQLKHFCIFCSKIMKTFNKPDQNTN